MWSRTVGVVVALFSAVAFADSSQPTLTVALTRRDGVTKRQAQALADQCVSVLAAGGLNVSKTALDATSCAAKKPCLVALARKQKVEVLIALEVANVLDEGVLRAEALSVDEDGKRITLTEYEGVFSAKAPIDAAFARLVAPLTALGKPMAEPTPAVTKAVEPPRTEAKPVVKEAPPMDTPAATATTAPPVPAAVVSVQETPTAKPMSGQTVAGVVALGVGGAAAIAAGVFAAKTLGDVKQLNDLCPDRRNCGAINEAQKVYDTATQSQTLAIGFGVGAGVAIAAGVILLVAKPAPAAPNVSVAFDRHGASVTLQGSW